MVWVGGDGMSVWVGVCCMCYIGACPTSPSSPPALRLLLGQQWLPPSQHTVNLLCCVCANVNGLPLQKSVKTANGFSLYFAILMDVSVHSSCFA